MATAATGCPAAVGVVCSSSTERSAGAETQQMNKVGRTWAFALVAMWLAACGNDNPPPPPLEQTGQACTAPSECFLGTDGAALMGGPAVCLDRVPGGYCTHLCTADTDCCAVPGECRTSYPQVCSPFESMG